MLIRLINWRRNGVFQISNKFIVGSLVGRMCRCLVRAAAVDHRHRFILFQLHLKVRFYRSIAAKIQVLRPNDKFIIVVVAAVVVRQNRNRNVRIDWRRYVVCAASDCSRSYASN